MDHEAAFRRCQRGEISYAILAKSRGRSLSRGISRAEYLRDPIANFGSGVSPFGSWFGSELPEFNVCMTTFLVADR